MKGSLDIGALDQRISLETQLPVALDNGGGRLASPTQLVTVWAAIAFGNPSATEQEARRAVREIIDVTIRWRAGVTRDSAVLWRGARYDVLTIETPDTQCRWLMLRCARDV